MPALFSAQSILPNAFIAFPTARATAASVTLAGLLHRVEDAREHDFAGIRLDRRCPSMMPSLNRLLYPTFDAGLTITPK